MNATIKATTVMEMPPVPMNLVASLVAAIWGLKEMASYAQVSTSITYRNCAPKRFLSPDIDECSSKMHDCHTNSTCEDTIGSFNCHCLPGFSGSGVQCYGRSILNTLYDKYLLHIL